MATNRKFNPTGSSYSLFPIPYSLFPISLPFFTFSLLHFFTFSLSRPRSVHCSLSTVHCLGQKSRGEPDHLAAERSWLPRIGRMASKEV